MAAEAFVLVAETFVAAEALVSSGGCGVVLAEVLVSGVFVSAEGLVFVVVLVLAGVLSLVFLLVVAQPPRKNPSSNINKVGNLKRERFMFKVIKFMIVGG
ncbi:MAG: hypothetical protein L0H37_07515 [Nitrosospira sp.]|nr:hypothetical protein [Nitrosospira sp.]